MKSKFTEMMNLLQEGSEEGGAPRSAVGQADLPIIYFALALSRMNREASGFLKPEVIGVCGIEKKERDFLSIPR